MLKQELNDVKDEMNHAIASENRTINKYKDCQSEHFKAKNGLNFLQYIDAINNAIDDSQYYTYLYNINLCKHDLHYFIF
ncbi:hypothetical protein KSF78_0008492 [Schistosoma japonicum]|nr:hypothetical protein KSF78_0008492 [Schistosoma japonicum]